MDTLILNSDGTPLTQIPLSVVPWQDSLRLMFLDKVKVLKDYEDWVIRSQKLEIKVPSIAIMSEHVKWNRHLKYNRNNVFLRDNFVCQLQTTSRCRAVAGKVKFTELTIDHVVPRSKGGKTTWVNVCTSCKDCNSKKGDDGSIVPKKVPHRPTYYEILTKRKNMPVYIKDDDWRHYLDWPDHLIILDPMR